MAIRDALSLEAARPPVVLGFNHKARSAPAYQISAKSDNPQDKLLTIQQIFPVSFHGANLQPHFLIPFSQGDE